MENITLSGKCQGILNRFKCGNPVSICCAIKGNDGFVIQVINRYYDMFIQ